MMNKSFCILNLMSLLLVFDLNAAIEDVDLKSLNINIDDYSNQENSILSPTYQVVIDPISRTKLYSQIQSPVVKINKKMGESFIKGDILIQLDDRVAKSNLAKALSALDRAKVEYEAKNQLFNENVASLFELKEAESNVASAQADVVMAQRDFGATKIEAPYDGKVVSLNVAEYELPKSGTELIEIVKDSTLLAKLLVPSFLLKKIKIGKKFQIILHGEDQPVIAVVKRIGSVIDPSSDTVKIEAEIDNTNGHLRAGMTGRADLETIETIPQPTDVQKDVSLKKPFQSNSTQLNKKPVRQTSSKSNLKKNANIHTKSVKKKQKSSL